MTLSERVGRLASLTAQAEDSAIPRFSVTPAALGNPGRGFGFRESWWRGKFKTYLIVIDEDAEDATIIHEFLHIIHPEWAEEQVESRCLELGEQWKFLSV